MVVVQMEEVGCYFDCYCNFDFYVYIIVIVGLIGMLFNDNIVIFFVFKELFVSFRL